ncbi:MAG: cobalamin biosynthesis protein, partial [Clostridiales bacterium]|nr:cobalamin biosynthesis protein [Clostridiales bacterium]
NIAQIIAAVPVITTASDSYGEYYNIQSPENLVLGIGCRKGLKPEDIERAVTIMLWDEKIPLSRVVCAATIDVKKNDIGLLGFATAHKLEIDFYTSAQLNGVIGKFSSSQRVLDRVGVDNVCERAAVLRGEKGRLIMGKKALNGVTTAVFEKE